MPHSDCKENDFSIQNTDLLLRRISPSQFEEGKITYDAFTDFRCSVEVKSKSSPERYLNHIYPDGFKLKNFPKIYEKKLKDGWRVCEIDAGFPRDHNQTVYFDPIEIPIKNEIFINEAHAEICGDKNRVLSLKLADRAKIVLGSS